MHYNSNMNHGRIDCDSRIHRYRKKYKYLKRRIKNLIIENAALCDEVAKIQESIFIVKEERKFLLRKVLEYENISEGVHSNPKILSPQVPVNGSKVKKRRSPDHNGRNNPNT